MQNIKCPKCGEIFQIDESGYAEIVKQVRDSEFSAEIKRREISFENEKKREIELALMKASAETTQEIEKLKSQLSSKDAQLNSVNEKAQSEIKIALAQKDSEIAALKGQLNSDRSKAELDIKTALQDKDRQILELKGKLELSEKQSQLSENTLKQKYEDQLKTKDEEIAYYKDFKARESTKQIGEDLEQYCLNEFNKNRAIGFQNAYFEKDNDARSGSKGDFIFRESSPDGVEFISIMFEMKNQMETTATKHKNEDFFKELDKDRNEKKCEYAVLVSMLEEDNDYYNTGIVDVSYKYPKMYVIRPQFFIPVITFLRNAALNSLDYKRQLIAVKNQNIDITNFEGEMNAFKEKFHYNVDLAMRQHTSALEEIDKAIKTLQKIKELFEKSDTNLRRADNKLEDLTVQKLVKNNPTMKEKFKELGVQF